MSSQPPRILRTTDEIWAYALAEPCPHGAHNPDDCSSCRLTPAERALIVTLLPGLRPGGRTTAA